MKNPPLQHHAPPFSRFPNERSKRHIHMSLAFSWALSRACVGGKIAARVQEPRLTPRAERARLGAARPRLYRGPTPSLQRAAPPRTPLPQARRYRDGEQCLATPPTPPSPPQPASVQTAVRGAAVRGANSFRAGKLLSCVKLRLGDRSSAQTSSRHTLRTSELCDTVAIVGAPRNCTAHLATRARRCLLCCLEKAVLAAPTCAPHLIPLLVQRERRHTIPGCRAPAALSISRVAAVRAPARFASLRSPVWSLETSRDLARERERRRHI
eukprot:360626-Chlamydomonas_euryale.AAC.4